jgi:hypothetical protein
LDETVRRLAIEKSYTEDIEASPRPWWFPSNIQKAAVVGWTLRRLKSISGIAPVLRKPAHSFK